MSKPEQSLKSTKSYIWYTGHILGTGATSNVYIGRHKKTGEQVAVKTFNIASFSRPADVQVRELDVLRKIKHRNIVDLFAIEDDQITKQPVIIMELCMGGSLYSILEEPKNIFGLQEEEFLIVLRDVTYGMMYLRENNIVHRDLKPGNIMRVIAEDDTSIYKLADFGAARELQEGTEFMSLYGTEEYLHPDLYQRAVMKVQNLGRFSAKIDLWSVGVTFYHVATGQLPFRPYGGRKNRNTMIYMTTKKPYGVISGVQHDSPNAEVIWASHLPETCHLPNPLKRHIKRLLSGLLECDINKMLSFDHFFKAVQDILSLKKVHVFNAVTSETVSIYIPPGDGWESLTTKIKEETRITTSEQFLCFKGQILDRNVIMDYSDTTVKNPIILFRHKLEMFASTIPPARPKLPKIATPYSLENDHPLAKVCSGSMYFYLDVVKSYLRMQDLMGVAVKNLCDILESKIEKMKLDIEMVKTHKVYCEEHVKWIICNLDLKMLDVIPENLRDKPFYDLIERVRELEQKMDSFKQGYKREMSEQIDKCFDEFQALYRKIVRDKVLEKTYDDKQICQPSENCYARFQVLVRDTKTIADQFKDDKRAKRLAYNEEQIHKMDKQKLSMKCTQGMSLLTDHCELKWREQHSRLGSWFTRTYFDYQSVVILMEKINEILLKFTIFRTRLDELKSQHDRTSMDIKQAISEAFHRKDAVYMRGSEPSSARPNMGAAIIQVSQERQRRKRNALITADHLIQFNVYQQEMKLLSSNVDEGVNQMKFMRVDR